MKKKILIILTFISVVSTIYAQQEAEIKPISDLYHQFETHIKDNNSTKHLDLYASPDVALYVVQIGAKNIKYSNSWNAKKWDTYATNPNYYLKISEQSYTNINNVSICTGNWEQFKNNKSNGKGKDQFLAINTNKGLKLVLLTNSVQQDAYPYKDVKFTNTPNSLVVDLIDCINHRENISIIKPLLNENVLFMNLTGIYSQKFIPHTHIAKNYLTELNQKFGDKAKLVVSNVKINIVDHFITHITSEYKYITNDTILESGNLIFSGFASSNNNWKINGVIFSNN